MTTRPTPKYPIYVISKGRWESRLTVKSLDECGLSYRVVIEPQEYDQYAAVIPPARLLVLPFGNLGQGSIPARNWVWEHSISEGHARHWILDDNINHFFRFYRGRRYYVKSGATFAAAEDFVDRYENVALAGMQYKMFAPEKGGDKWPPFALNTRVYSCILIQNDIAGLDGVPYRWRGRYNEDTDLSLRALKDGWCTILFDAFLADKIATMTMRGGNTEELYQDDGRLKMARSLVEQHPDVTRVVWKWGRWQHSVDYRPFRNNRLRLRPGVEIPEGVNNYGLALVRNGELAAEFQPA